MISESVALLGVPIDNLTIDEAVDRIFQMVEEYQNDSIPRQVATVNVDFLVNTLSLRPNHPRHPELLDIFRNCDLVTADGMPVVWASSLLNSPLKRRVTGSDLVPALAKAAAEKGRSIYLLGGRHETAEKAAEVLVSQYPGLKIAGVSSPDVITEGEGIADSYDNDALLVNQINNAKPDILFVGFGNPKQEMWFRRNRKILKAPVTIGIGGTYEFIAGSVSRAPGWMQDSGIEWIYRIIQEPKRLWKRYFIGFFKFTAMLFPLMVYSRYMNLKNKFLFKRYASKNGEYRLIHDQRIGIKRVIKTPGSLDRDSVNSVNELIRDIPSSRTDILLDLKNTYHIDLYGMGFLIRLYARCNKDKRRLYVTGANPQLKRLLKLNRLLDISQDISYKEPGIESSLINTKRELPPFKFSTYSAPGCLRVELNGRLDADFMAGFDIASLTGLIGQRDCILDLSDLEFVDSSGLVFFIKLKKYMASYSKTPVLFNVNDNVMQILKITKILNLFDIQSPVLLKNHTALESYA